VDGSRTTNQPPEVTPAISDRPGGLGSPVTQAHRQMAGVLSNGFEARVLHEVRVTVASDQDIVTARQQGRRLAEESGFTASDLTLIATAISEVARNIVRYATRGDILLRLIENDREQGVEVVAVDQGPGIPDVSLALQEGYSTSGGLGLGLAGVRRLMDEFQIRSRFSRGTTVTLRKWRR
jgi:serine/threonine-protein kinase RsbT